MCQEVGQVAKLVIVAMGGWACVNVLQTLRQPPIE